MADIEKVIKGLEKCTSTHGCFECPYSEDGYSPTISCKVQIDRDALQLIKEQQQMYWTLEHDWRMLRDQLATQSNTQKSALDVR